MIDFHCHIDLYQNPAHIAKECAKRGLYVLSVTTTPSAWQGTNELAMGQIRTALGLHPELAHERKKELGLFDELLPDVSYVGEVGLDGSSALRRFRADQLDVFKHILGACCRAGGRVMSIHSRHASQEVLDLLEIYPSAGIPVLHWFSGDHGSLNRAISLGCWFSVGPGMLRTAKGRAIVSSLPKNRVLPESDGPFVRNGPLPLYPWDMEQVTTGVSKLWGIDRERIDQLLLENLSQLIRGPF